MKKISLFFALSMPLMAQAESPYKIDESPKSFYGITESINNMRLSQASNDNFLFFGDSIVQALKQNKLHVNYVNMGIAGDTVHGVMKQIKEAPIGNFNGILVSVGANNLLQGQHGKELGDEIGAVIDYAAPRTKQLYVMETFVPNRLKYPFISPDFDAANRIIYKTCSQYKNCQVIPLPKGMIGKDGIDLKYTISDGVHPNALGFTLWKREINKKMANFPYNLYYRVRY
ncbi:SGNH/GDSL hydrolase family protein [Enterobacter asburiae]|uniref:SGNH/GDSL hydrolase family protein n=1 Tax=Enterobacter asburiae TaxID=61645 RepID=UPI00301D34B0